MDIIQLIVQAIASQTATDILTAAGIYIVVPLFTHIQIQFIKYDRRERRKPELGRWTLRGIAFILTFTVATFIGWRVGGWAIEMAVDHAVNIAILYPVAMWAFMAWLKAKNLDAYRKLNAPRRRPTDHVDPKDSDPNDVTQPHNHNHNKDPNSTSTTWAGGD